MNSDIKLFGDFVIFFCMGIWSMLSGGKDYLFYRKVVNTPTSNTASIAIGLVEVAGHAEKVAPLKSPISHSECAYWRIIGEYYRSGKYRGWHEIFRLDSGTLFYLRDGTGRVPLDPAGAEIDIAADRVYTGYLPKSASVFSSEKLPHLDAPAQRYIDQLDEKYQDLFKRHSGEKIRISESFIVDGDPLYALGSAVEREGVAPGPAPETVIIRKGFWDPTMFIADTHEKRVREKRFMWMYPKIFIGLAVSAGCLAVLVILFGMLRDPYEVLIIMAAMFLIVLIWTCWERYHDHIRRGG